MANNEYELIENYIYLYHVDEFIILPSFPEQLQDTLSVSFASNTILSRSAPIFSYSNSGPRTMQISLNLHRDLMYQINYKRSNLKISIGDDYVDTIISHIQAAALPNYDASEKLVDPPMVAVRFGDDIYIKGIVNGSVGVSYALPILRNGKYAQVGINFQVTEVDPYDAQQVMNMGSFRGLDSSLERSLFGGGTGGLSGITRINA